MEKIRKAVEAAQAGALPSSKLGQAIHYTLEMWAKLERFLEDPVVELSNNVAENSMRPEPGQPFPPFEWAEDQLKRKGALAVRASKKLKESELLMTSMAGTRLRLEIDQVPLWRANHVGVKQLVGDLRSTCISHA